jgi:hypothetical protein
MTLARMGGVYAALHAGHAVGDIWVQRDSQAVHKGDAGWAGRRACASHVVSVAATQAAFLAAACAVTGDRVPVRRALLGLAVNAASHYVTDRRRPLRWLAHATGNQRLHDLGAGPFGSGAYQLDQAWHIGWCAATAAIITGKG